MLARLNWMTPAKETRCETAPEETAESYQLHRLVDAVNLLILVLKPILWPASSSSFSRRRAACTVSVVNWRFSEPSVPIYPNRDELNRELWSPQRESSPTLFLEPWEYCGIQWKCANLFFVGIIIKHIGIIIKHK